MGKRKIAEETTLFLIKPEAMKAGIRDEIHHIIIRKGSRLRISGTRNITYTREMLDLTYGELAPNQIALAEQHLIGRECEVGLVTGPNAIEQLVAICGDKLNPDACQSGTIRYMLAEARNLGTPDAPFFLNYIHRPRDDKERDRDLKTFGLV